MAGVEALPWKTRGRRLIGSQIVRTLRTRINIGRRGDDEKAPNWSTRRRAGATSGCPYLIALELTRDVDHLSGQRNLRPGTGPAAVEGVALGS